MKILYRLTLIRTQLLTEALTIFVLMHSTLFYVSVKFYPICVFNPCMYVNHVVDFISIGLAQCTELCSQLRGECGKRQVPGARIALQHNLGLGGAVVVALYKMAFSQ